MRAKGSTFHGQAESRFGQGVGLAHAQASGSRPCAQVTVGGLVQVIWEQRYVKAPHADTDSDFCGMRASGKA